MKAIRNGNLEIINFLIDEAEMDINRYSLNSAIESGNIEVVKIMKEYAEKKSLALSILHLEDVFHLPSGIERYDEMAEYIIDNLNMEDSSSISNLEKSCKKACQVFSEEDFFGVFF